MDAGTAAFENYIAERTVPDGIITRTPQPDALTVTVQYTIIHCNMLANSRNILMTADGTQDQTVI